MPFQYPVFVISSFHKFWFWYHICLWMIFYLYSMFALLVRFPIWNFLNLMGIPLHVICCFSSFLFAFNFCQFDQYVSQGVSLWIYPLWDSLSADGWGCVPTLLVLQPEVSQHWSLQPVGWNQVLMTKRQPLGEFTPMNIPWGLCHQCPCHHSEPQLTPTSSGHSTRSTGRSNSGSYKSLLFRGSQRTWNLVFALKTAVFFPPVLWRSFTQVLLAFKAKYSRSSSSW